MPSIDNAADDEDEASALLQRLNQLKKSDITFSKSPSLHHAPPYSSSHSSPSFSAHESSDAQPKSLKLGSGSRNILTDEHDGKIDRTDNDSDLTARFLRLQNLGRQGERLCEVESRLTESNSKKEAVDGDGDDDGEENPIKDTDVKRLEKKFLEDARESLSQDYPSDESCLYKRGAGKSRQVKVKDDEYDIVRGIESGAWKLADTATKRSLGGNFESSDDEIVPEQHVETDVRLETIASAISINNLGDEQSFATGLSKKQDIMDNREANEYVARVLDELAIESVPEDEDDEDDDDDDEGEENESEVDDGSSTNQSADTVANSFAEGSGKDEKSVSLPEAPDGDVLSNAIVSSSVKEGKKPMSSNSGEISLPEVPTFAPIHNGPARRTTKTTSIPQYTDEDIESWCIICNEDATVKCLGCDGDLYCAKCWYEGHMTRESGYDERGHKKISYQRNK